MKNATPITRKDLDAFSNEYANSELRRAMTNVLAHTEIADAAINDAAMKKVLHKFSIDIPTMAVTAQKASGRCWLFAALNLLREIIAKEKNIEFFELSQSYAAFWDKFERVNYFYESIISTANREADDRTVAYVLQTGVQDGGQWDMFVNIVKKYGVVPKDAMPETKQSSATGELTKLINEKIRGDAAVLRDLIASGASAEAVAAKKNEMLNQIYGFLCTCYGEPPASFDFEYVDKDKEYHIEKGYTPASFCEKYIGSRLDDYISIIHAPTKDKPYNALYTVDLLGNVVEGGIVRYLNLPMEEFKALVLNQLKDGEIVWFGSDVGFFGSRDRGIWDDASFDYQYVTGFPAETTKEQRLDYRISAMNHAMVLTGVNLDDGKPNRWKIENSWGDEKGDKGYYVCSDTWFDKYVFQAVVHKKYLGEKAAILESEPTVLKPWDPMGSLAE